MDSALDDLRPLIDPAPVPPAAAVAAAEAWPGLLGLVLLAALLGWAWLRRGRLVAGWQRARLVRRLRAGHPPAAVARGLVVEVARVTGRGAMPGPTGPGGADGDWAGFRRRLLEAAFGGAAERPAVDALLAEWRRWLAHVR